MPGFDTFDDSGVFADDAGASPIGDSNFIRPQTPWAQRLTFTQSWTFNAAATEAPTAAITKATAQSPSDMTASLGESGSVSKGQFKKVGGSIAPGAQAPLIFDSGTLDTIYDLDGGGGFTKTVEPSDSAGLGLAGGMGGNAIMKALAAFVSFLYDSPTPALTRIQAQTGQVTVNGAVTLTMPSPPTADNMLFAIGMSPNAFTIAPPYATIIQVTVGSLNVKVAYRVVPPNEPALQNPFNTSGSIQVNTLIEEYNGAAMPRGTDLTSIAGTAASPPTATLTPSLSQTGCSVLLAAGVNEGASGTSTLPGATIEGSSNTSKAFVYGRQDNVPIGTTYTVTFGAGTASMVCTLCSFNIRPANRLQRAISSGQSAAGLSFTGSINKAVAVLRTAGLSFTGAIAAIHVVLKALTATITSSGAVQKAISVLRSAGLSFTGSRSVAIHENKSASISDTGSTSKQTDTSKTATISSSGTLTRAIRKLLSAASLSFSGALSTSGQVTKNLNAALSFVGNANKATKRALAASESESGTIGKLTAAVRSAALSEHGVAIRAIAVVRVADLVASGQVRDAISVAFTAVLAATGLLGTARTFQEAFTAAIAPDGTINKELLKQLTASILSGGFLGRTFAVALVASVGLTGGLRRLISVARNAVLSYLGTLIPFAFRPQRVILVLPIVTSASLALPVLPTEMELTLPIESEVTLSL